MATLYKPGRKNRSFQIICQCTKENNWKPNKSIYYTEHRVVGPPTEAIGKVGDTYLDLQTEEVYARLENGWQKWRGTSPDVQTLFHPVYRDRFLWLNRGETHIAWISEQTRTWLKQASDTLPTTTSELIHLTFSKEQAAKLKRRKENVSLTDEDGPEKKKLRLDTASLTPSTSGSGSGTPLSPRCGLSVNNEDCRTRPEYKEIPCIKLPELLSSIPPTLPNNPSDSPLQRTPPTFNPVPQEIRTSTMQSGPLEISNPVVHIQSTLNSKGWWTNGNSEMNIHIIEKRLFGPLSGYASSEWFDQDFTLLFDIARNHYRDSPHFGHVLSLQRFYNSVTSPTPYQNDSQFQTASARHFAHLLGGPGKAIPNPPILRHPSTSKDFLCFKGSCLRVGDWVHLANPNNPSKPIIGLIFSLWSDSAGEVIRVAWYYRPEQARQTHHSIIAARMLNHPRQRITPVQDFLEKVAVQFAPQYLRGRPTAHFWTPNMPLYVCHSYFDDVKAEYRSIKDWQALRPPSLWHDQKWMKIIPFTSPQVPSKVPSSPVETQHYSGYYTFGQPPDDLRSMLPPFAPPSQIVAQEMLSGLPLQPSTSERSSLKTGLMPTPATPLPTTLGDETSMAQEPTAMNDIQPTTPHFMSFDPSRNTTIPPMPSPPSSLSTQAIVEPSKPSASNSRTLPQAFPLIPPCSEVDQVSMEPIDSGLEPISLPNVLSMMPHSMSPARAASPASSTSTSTSVSQSVAQDTVAQPLTDLEIGLAYHHLPKSKQYLCRWCWRDKQKMKRLDSSSSSLELSEALSSQTPQQGQIHSDDVYK
ncbi:hypothetical protein DL96DRAFT_1703706 [Flagelloscypha sp. PMI_526]|nr:hypothetical protein DL96DRAFT_1703706 [Flagelloscypha sp. PMI_526]